MVNGIVVLRAWYAASRMYLPTICEWNFINMFRKINSMSRNVSIFHQTNIWVKHHDSFYSFYYKTINNGGLNASGSVHSSSGMAYVLLFQATHCKTETVVGILLRCRWAGRHQPGLIWCEVISEGGTMEWRCLIMKWHCNPPTHPFPFRGSSVFWWG
jgi:hypothetical protein